MKILKWWIGAVVMFALMIDIALFMMGMETISYVMQQEFGGHWPSNIFAFICGGLFVHFTKWGPQRPS